MRTHLVWGKEVGPDGPGGLGDTVVLYCGEDAVEADRIYNEHCEDGRFDYVRLNSSVSHMRVSTPARLGCPVKGAKDPEAPKDPETPEAPEQAAPAGKKKAKGK